MTFKVHLGKRTVIEMKRPRLATKVTEAWALRKKGKSALVTYPVCANGLYLGIYSFIHLFLSDRQHPSKYRWCFNLIPCVVS